MVPQNPRSDAKGKRVQYFQVALGEATDEDLQKTHTKKEYKIAQQYVKEIKDFSKKIPNVNSAEELMEILDKESDKVRAKIIASGFFENLRKKTR